MATEYFSSQTTIEAKVRASRVKLWGDKNADGTLDPATLEQALASAKSIILSYVARRYPQALDLTFSGCPPLLRALSDDLTLYYLASGANAVNPVQDLNYKNAVAMLTMIRDYENDVPELDDSTALQTTTEETESVFDDLLLSEPSTSDLIIIR